MNKKSKINKMKKEKYIINTLQTFGYNRRKLGCYEINVKINKKN